MPEIHGVGSADLRARANQLRDVLSELDDGELQASTRERAFISGSLQAVELLMAGLNECVNHDRSNGFGRGPGTTSWTV